MRSFWCALLVAFAVCTAARAEKPTPLRFTAEFAQALTRAMPSTSVRITRPLQVIVRRADGSSATVNLGHLYEDYSPDPAWLDGVIKAHAERLAKPLPVKPAPPIDRARIVPLVKDRSWLAGLQERFNKQDPTQRPVFDELNAELIVVYAEDRDKITRYLTSSENLGVPRSELRDLAVENVMRLMPPIELRQSEDGFFLMTSHADYGASLLLVDQIWRGDQIEVNGDVVVAVPAKDAILVTGSRNRKALKGMREAAQRLAKGRYGMIDTLFVYRKGRFVKFGRD
jgi:Protein of unknown function (DUF1444)